MIKNVSTFCPVVKVVRSASTESGDGFLPPQSKSGGIGRLSRMANAASRLPTRWGRG